MSGNKILALVVIAVVLFVSFPSGRVSAAEKAEYPLGHGWEYGVDYTECSPELEKRIRESFEIERLKTMPEISEGIFGFDVSESGKIVLVMQDNQFFVVDERGNFKYAYKYSVNGGDGGSWGDYGALWADENILFLSCRGGFAAVLSDSGSMIKIYEFTDEYFENSNYWTEIVDARTRTVNGYTYENAYHKEGEIVVDTIVRTDVAGNSEEVCAITYKPSYRDEKTLLLFLVAFVVLGTRSYFQKKKESRAHSA